MTITIQQLFRGRERELDEIVRQTRASVPAKDIAEKLIQPILPDLTANAGQEMDAKFVAYLVQYVLNSISSNSQ